MIQERHSMMISGITGRTLLKLTNKTMSKISNGKYKMYLHQLMRSESPTPEKMTKATNANHSTNQLAKLRKG